MGYDDERAPGRGAAFAASTRGRRALLVAAAALLCALSGLCEASRPRAAVALCGVAGVSFAIALAHDALSAREDAAEAASVRAYAPEVAAALTRRALARDAAVFAALSGGGLLAAAASALWGCVLTCTHAQRVAAAVPGLAGLWLLDVALFVQLWDARALRSEVAAANGETPPGWVSHAPLRAQAGLLLAAACLTAADAALLAQQPGAPSRAAAMLFDAGAGLGALVGAQTLRLAWREHAARLEAQGCADGGGGSGALDDAPLASWGAPWSPVAQSSAMGYGSCACLRRGPSGADGGDASGALFGFGTADAGSYATRIAAGPFLVGHGGAGGGDADEEEMQPLAPCTPLVCCGAPQQPERND